MAYITRELELYIPKREDLWFYQQMMADPETMATTRAGMLPMRATIGTPAASTARTRRLPIGTIAGSEMSRSASMLTSNAA